MKFNDREWYVASPIQESEVKRIAQGELIAKNNNIEAYKNISKNDFAYIYVLKLEGSDKTYIAISSNDDQDGQGYGLDFNYFIEFSLDGRVTIPDMNFEME